MTKERLQKYTEDILKIAGDFYADRISRETVNIRMRETITTALADEEKERAEWIAS